MLKEWAWKQPSSTAENRAAEAALLSQTEDAWMAARLRGNRKIVDQLVDDSYRGANSHGLAQAKNDLLNSVKPSAGSFTECIHSERGD